MVSVMSFGNPKTADEIERDIYEITRKSVRVKGNVYRKGTRPTNRTDKEDVVVSFLSGRDGQIQDGVVVVNCYVPHLNHGDVYTTKNARRTEEVARMLLNIITPPVQGNYLLKSDRTVETVEEEGVSRCTLRIRYRYNTID